MSDLFKPLPCKLVFSILFTSNESCELVIKELVTLYGEIESQTDQYNFKYTDYYTKEMGQPINRKLIAFKKLVERDSLVSNKLNAVQLESKTTQLYSDGKNRVVNLDPGHLSAEKFVLASGKNFTHRIYLNSGVFADLTLIYTKKGNDYSALPWTYPDYIESPVKEFLFQSRQTYLNQVKHLTREKL